MIELKSTLNPGETNFGYSVLEIKVRFIFAYPVLKTTKLLLMMKCLRNFHLSKPIVRLTDLMSPAYVVH
jgi:hypothetical protein